MSREKEPAVARIAPRPVRKFHRPRCFEPDPQAMAF